LFAKVIVVYMKRSLKLSLAVLTLPVLVAIAVSLIARYHFSPASASSLTEPVEPKLFMPVIVKPFPKPPDGLYDLATYMVGDGRLYEVWRSVNDSQARHQTQVDGGKFFHTKGSEVSAEWEELWASSNYIYRGTDTSPGNGEYYTLREFGQYGSPWAPRFWNIGGIFERNPVVTFYRDSDCAQVNQGTHKTWLKFENFHSTYTFPGGITLNDVIELAWLLAPNADPVEKYYYAKFFGLVGWSSSDRGFSHISEIHAPGTRPDNTREIIDCLNKSGQPFGLDWAAPIAPLPPAYIEKLFK
jgi:hypothetical protein